MAKLLGRVTGLPGWALPSSSSEFAHRISVTNHQFIAQDERQAPTTAPHHYRVSGLGSMTFRESALARREESNAG